MKELDKEVDRIFKLDQDEDGIVSQQSAEKVLAY
jgi:hypothetical protein